MSILIVILAVLFISFILAWVSLKDYNGHTETRKISSDLNKQRIRGSITFGEGQSRPIHHSSKSS